MSPAELVRFHTRHKLQLMAHSPEAQRALGRLVAEAGGPEHPAVVRRYMTLFSVTMSSVVRRERHVNALEHAAGYFRDLASAEERFALHASISSFRRGDLSLRAMTALIRGYAVRYGLPYLLDQSYFDGLAGDDD